MPIWIKCILMLWALAIIGVGYDFLYVYANPDFTSSDLDFSDYPTSLKLVGVIHMLSFYALIPFAVWLIFLR